MAVIISVVSGGSVVQAQQLGSKKSSATTRISAIEGARYVLADTQGGGAAAGVTVKRIGKNLVIGRDLDGAEQEALIIEDYFGSGGQLVAQAADGSYQDYMAVTDGGAIDAAQMSDRATSALTLVAAQPAVSVAEFQFSEGGSSQFGSALASAAAVAGGIALSTGKDGGGKASAAPAASALVLEDRLADVAIGQPTPAMAGEGVVATVNDIAASADSNAEIESGAKPEAVTISSNVLDGEAATVAPFAVGDIPVIDKVVDDYGIIQGVVENGGYTDDGYPTIMGKADPGVKVHIYRNTFLLNYVIADANGEWSYTSTTSFASGKHSITIVHEYPNKEISEPSPPYVITVDKIPPAIPVITGIVDDVGRITGAITDQTITDDNRPTINGKAEAHAKVIVYDKGKEIGSTTAGADGKWSFTPDIPLADGVHMLSYSALDRAGNSSQQTAVTEFFVDTRPEKINIYHAEDDVGSVTGDVFNGGVTDDSTPTLFGTATAGGIVKIYEGGVLLGQTIADVDGTWQFTPIVALSEGAHTFHATVTLVAKGESDRSKPFMLEVDLTPPGAPTIEQVLDDVGTIQGVIEKGQVTDDTMPTLTGKAEKGSAVKIFDNGLQLGSVVADSNGGWTYTPSTPLANGLHSFAVTATDGAGNTTASADQYPISIDTVAPEAPSILSVVDDVGPIQGALHNGATTDDAEPTISGKAEANSTVIVRDHGVEIGRVQANAEGDWTFTPTSDLNAGPHRITVVSMDKAGNVSLPSAPFDFDVSFVPPVAPTIVSIYDDVGLSKGFLGSGATTDDTLPQVNGKANPNSTVILKDNGVEIGRVLADASGDWTFLPVSPLSLGLHNLVATSLDKAGNPDASSSVFGFRVVEAGGAGGMENFNSLPGGSAQVVVKDLVLPSGAVLTGSFRVASNSYEAAVGSLRPEDLRSKIYMYGGDTATINLPDEARKVSFFSQSGASSNYAAYFDANGVKLGQTYLSGDGGNYFSKIQFEAPAGTLIASIKFVSFASGSATCIDALQWGDRYPTGISISTAHSDDFGGRIVYGTVSGIATLDPNMAIQVSTDGGKTWTNAVFSEGSWVAIQKEMPLGDWTAEVRMVQHSSGMSLGLTDAKVVVVQGAVAPAIERIADAEGMYTAAKAADGSLIEVSLDGTGAKQGDKVHIRWGSITYDHVLTKANIDAGHATVKMPAEQILVQGVKTDFSVTAQIIGKNGTIGALSEAYKVVGTYTVSAPIGDALQMTPENNAYWGSGFNVTTTGVMTKDAQTASTHAGLTLTDAERANALFVLDKPAREITLRLSGIDSELGVKIQLFDVNGQLIEEQIIYGDATAFHANAYAYAAKNERVDIGSFKIIANEKRVTLDGFTRKDVSHAVDVRDLNVIETDMESFYGTSGDDVVLLNMAADKYFLGLNTGIHGGAGIDTLKLAAVANSSLKMSSNISSMEIIEIGRSNGTQYVQLSLTDVLGNGGTDIFYVGNKSRVQMMIKGQGANACVYLDDKLLGGVDLNPYVENLPGGAGDMGDWVKKTAVKINGVTYDSYQHSSLAVEVLTQQGMTVALNNRAEFIESGVKSLRSESLLESIDLNNSSILKPAVTDLLSPDSHMSDSGYSVEGVNDSFHTGRGFASDLLDSHHVMNAFY